MNHLIIHLWIAQWILCAFCAFYKYSLLIDFILTLSTLWVKHKIDEVPYLFLNTPTLDTKKDFENFFI
jgi:hypothetical protein